MKHKLHKSGKTVNGKLFLKLKNLFEIVEDCGMIDYV